MVKGYKFCPLEEALCEFKFISDLEWDLTIPGLIYEKVKDNYPIKKQQIGIGIKLEPKGKGIEQSIEQAPPRIQLFEKEEKGLIQIAPDLLVINRLKPYPGWNIFKPMITEAVDSYKLIAQPKGLKRVGLRYINIFEFSHKNIKLREYFNFYPYIPDNFQNNPKSFADRVEFPYENDNEILILQLVSIIPRKPNISSIALDIDYAMITPDYVSLDKVNEWLEKAHEIIVNSFESAITDKTKNLITSGVE